MAMERELRLRGRLNITMDAHIWRDLTGSEFDLTEFKI